MEPAASIDELIEALRNLGGRTDSVLGGDSVDLLVHSLQCAALLATEASNDELTLLGHLVEVARRRGYESLSLETGTSDAFAAARSLYERSGFTRCAPFGEYTANPHSVCMRLLLPHQTV
jgi:GNAT superfamily N-acetyltransferase